MTPGNDTTVPTQAGGRPVRALTVTVVRGAAVGRSIAVVDDVVTVGTAEGNALVLDDRTVSRYHLELARSGDRVRVTDLGSTNGTEIGPVLLKRGSALVTPGAVLTVGASQIRVDDGEVKMAAAFDKRDAFGGIRGHSTAMRALMKRVEELAGSTVSVLVLGESGVGKEVVARALHETGPRRGRPFVVVDCGSIPPNLFASELYGHERGAFTGAEKRHEGAFERAHGGTLFLDEIGELPPDQQTALLGALERRRIKRVGGSAEIAVDVRVLAATHRDLRAGVNAGTFRLDLYYRLAVVHLQIAPLRERPEDIPLLVEHFLREDGRDEPVEQLFSREVMDRLLAHDWPGNARELRNVVAASVAMGEPPSLRRAAIPSTDAATALLDEDYRDARARLLTDFERRYLARLLERSQGNFREAARIGRIDRSHLLDLLRRHGFR